MRRPNYLKKIMALAESGIDLKTSQAAIYLNLSPRTLEKYRTTGEGPCFRRYGRAVRYPVADLDAWKNARVFNSTTEQKILTQGATNND